MGILDYIFKSRDQMEREKKVAGEKRDQELLNQADRLFEEKKYDECLKICMKLVNRNFFGVSYWNAYLHAASILYRKGHYREVIEVSKHYRWFCDKDSDRYMEWYVSRSKESIEEQGNPKLAPNPKPEPSTAPATASEPAIRNNCVAYIHGHSAGETNPSLVEAMFFGKPVIAYGCVYNRETTENKAIYFDSSEDLKLKLVSIFQDEGDKMKEIALRRYTWDCVAAEYERLFSFAGL